MTTSSAGEWIADVHAHSGTRMAVAPTGNVYLFDADGVFVYDRWGRPLADVDQGGQPSDMAWHDGAMYLIRFGDIVEIDDTTHTVTATFPDPGSHLGQSIASDGDLLYVHSDGDVYSLDPDTGVFTDLGIDTSAYGILRTSPALPDALFVGVPIFEERVERWDVGPQPATLDGTSPANGSLNGLVDFQVDPDGTTVYVGTSSDRVLLLDAMSLEEQSTLALPDRANSLSIAPTGRLAAATDDQVVLWDTGESEPVETWDVPGRAGRSRIAISSDGERVYALSTIHDDLHVMTFVPGAPADVAVIAGDGELSVAWDPADDDADEFTATASPGGANCTTTGTSCTIDGLTNGVAYRITVAGSNGLGEGAPSEPSEAVVPDVPPGRPTSVTVDDAGTVTWAAGSGGAPLDYTVTYAEYETPGGWLAPSVAGGSITPIDNHRHTVKLLAFNGVQDFLFECDGVLISLEWVLTAAHCTEYFTSPSDTAPSRPFDFVVLYGLRDWTGAIDDLATFRRFAREIRKPSSYSHESPARDIALLRLEQPADARYASPIPVADFVDPVDGDPAFVAGWGATTAGGVPSDDLRGLEVTVDGSCGDWPAILGDDFSDGMLCTSADGAGACDGDSGGPLVVNHGGVLFLAGIVSFRSSAGCGAQGVGADRPDVHTRVSHYLDWIEGTTGDLTRAADVAGTTATLVDLLPGRSYMTAVTAVNDTGDATRVRRFSVDGQKLLTSDEVGVDCSGTVLHPFVDVPLGSFAIDSVGCIYRLGVTTGTGPDTYSPADFVTRAQMAAFMARFFERLSGETCTGTHPFNDVLASSFAFGPVGCIFELGITKGTSATTYDPGAFVTREQMAAFIGRLYRQLSGEPCGSEPAFDDVGAGSFAYLDVGCIHGLGVTTGTSPSTYSPASLVTREQMAAFLERLYLALT